jgi:HPt (histidine-containing phosphotransfer) domain-containing protein
MPNMLLFVKEQLLRNLDDDEDFANSLLNDALTEIPKDVEKLEESCQGDDIRAIQMQAHTIKGMSANLCTPALQEIAKKMEIAAKCGDLESAREILPELVSTARMTIEAIRDECE